MRRTLLALFLAACVPVLDDDTVPVDDDDTTCVDCPTDADGDGVDSTTDCNDNDATILPGAGEPCVCDEIDQDCTGDPIDFDCDLACGTTVDADGDGADQFIDCDDADPSIFPGAEEPCVCDEIDQDCSGLPRDFDCLLMCEGEDVDGDGATADIDCNDTDASIHPGADEPCLCDAIDQDCNDAVDDFPCDMVCDYRDVGELCPGPGGEACAVGLVCCYPCGVAGCDNQCMVPCTDPWCSGGCPLYP